MSGKRVSEGGKRHKARHYVAMVEGEDRGIVFRTFYKRMDAAQRDAQATRSTLTDLTTLRRTRWVNSEWRDA
jgi:hypothetical protein